MSLTRCLYVDNYVQEEHPLNKNTLQATPIDRNSRNLNTSTTTPIDHTNYCR